MTAELQFAMDSGWGVPPEGGLRLGGRAEPFPREWPKKKPAQAFEGLCRLQVDPGGVLLSH